MKEEELDMKHSSHNIIYISEHKHEEQQTITREDDNGVCQSHLHLRAFVSVGEAFLFLFNSLKIHQKSVKWITNWFDCVMIHFKNPTQPMKLQTVERSSRK